MPLSAFSILPMVWRTAPVKAPFSWPKSSLSSSVSGMAAQLMATNGPLARALRRWIACASSSLPVPLSPSSSTATSVGRDLLDHAQQPDHHASLVPRTPSIGERGAAAARLAVLGLELVQPEGALDDEAQHVDIDRLLEEIVGAERDAAQRVLAVLVAGGDDDLGVGRELAQRLERGQAFAGAVGIGRQAEIDDRHRRRASPRASASASSRVLASSSS